MRLSTRTLRPTDVSQGHPTPRQGMLPPCTSITTTSADLLFFANFIWLLVGLQACGRRRGGCSWRTAGCKHVFKGASVALFLIWIFEIGVRPALGFHFLGVTVYT